jgi:Mg-chelatase subunit ChlI
LGIERVLYGADARGGTAGAKPGYETKTEETTVVPDWVLEFQREQQAQLERRKVSARAVAKSLASALGMQESIVDKLADLQINQGYTEESVQVAMRDLPEFKQRFAGMINTIRTLLEILLLVEKPKW